jgi:septal ring factor EnvC (AmiA/AmiB activator)
MKETDFETLGRQWRDLTLQTWGAMASQTLDSPAVTGLLTASLDLYLAAQKRLRQAAIESLESLEIPTRTEMARLSRQILTAESRVAECEERLDEAHQRLERLQTTLEGLLEALQSKAEPPRPAAKPRRKTP